jgi:proline iminopeptidase
MKVQIEPNVHLYVDVEGAGLIPDANSMIEKPTLILLHGGPGSDHTSFKPFFTRFADIAQIIYYDHRGHGRSDFNSTEALTLDVLADDIVKLCHVLGIIKPIVLGQSFGGFVAQRYIARHPEHPSKVILSSTSPTFGLERKLIMFNTLGGSKARIAAEQFWTKPSKLSYDVYTRICKPLYSSVAPALNSNIKSRTIFRNEILFKWVSGEYQTMNLLPGLIRAKCPVLVIAGKLDPVCPIDDSLDIVSALPENVVQFEQFRGCGHGVWRDDPDKALFILRQFILG